MLTAELIDKTIASAHSAAAALQAKNWVVPQFTVRFDVRGKRAGEAYMNYATGEAYVRFNPWHLEQQTDDMLRQTVPHEIAHLASFATFRYHGHGGYWARAMRQLGLEPTRCHSFERDPKSKHCKRFKHVCAHGECTFGVRVYRAVKFGRRYTRKHCGCTLQPNNIVEVKREEV